MRHFNRLPAIEYQRVDGAPLQPERLAQIQKALPESERFGFLMSLTDELADKLIALAPAQPAEKGIDHGK